MTTELTFEKDGLQNVCKIDSYNKGDIIQVWLDGSAARVSVSANIPDMPPAFIGLFENPYGDSVIFTLDIPDGLEVTLKTTAEVKKALWMQ